MRNWTPLFIVAALLFFSHSIANAEVPSERPNAISVELLGRGALYSINFDRFISDSVGIGGGFGFYSGPGSDPSISVTVGLFPIYMNYYLPPFGRQIFVTGGLTIMSGAVNQNGLRSTDAGGAVVVGGGYEFRGTRGFLFRVAPYLLINTQVRPWAGLSFGYAF